MKSRTWPCIIAMTLFATLAIPVRLAAQAHNQHQPRYTITDLGTLGGTFSQAFGINNKESVVGFATLTGDTALHAFLWRKGLMTDLGTLGGSDSLPYSQAFSVNERDEVVGFSETSVSDPLGENFCGDSLVCLPVFWRDGDMTALPTLGGNNGMAVSINDRGQVAGVAETGEKDSCPPHLVVKPAIWENAEPRALPTAPFRDGFMGGNNNRGQVVGNVVNCNSSAGRAYLWEKNKVINMGTIGGLGLSPSSINNKGQATGTYTTTAGIDRGFLWQNGVAMDLGALPGDPVAHGNVINDRGQIAGQSCDQSGFPHCSVFLWQNGVMTDLNTLVPRDSTLNMVDAGDINSRGEIVGLAIHKITGAFLAFLATPCDEEDADSEGCEDRAEGTTVVRGETNQRPNVVLPEIVRRLLQQRLRFGQFGVGR
jgi:probable HAF family extracellular repeat protein